MAVITLSYSARSDAKCMRYFQKARIKKIYPYEESKAQRDGKQMHSRLELAHKSGDTSALKPAELACFEYATSLKGMDEKVIPEKRMAVALSKGNKLESCGYFDKNPAPYYRGAADAIGGYKENGRVGVTVVDYKNGNPDYFDEEQLLDMAAMVMLCFDGIDEVQALFISARSPEAMAPQVYTRWHLVEQIKKWAATYAKIRSTNESHGKLVWPATRGDQCRFCQDKTCIYNPAKTDNMELF